MTRLHQILVPLIILVLESFQSITSFSVQSPTITTTRSAPCRQVLLRGLSCATRSRFREDPCYRRYKSPRSVTYAKRTNESEKDNDTKYQDDAASETARVGRSDSVDDEDENESYFTRTRGHSNNNNNSNRSSPDRAISIVAELKSNAALFAAFAFGSLNLPSTLTVSESKVTSVTTSLSVSRPLPESELIRTFVVLDVFTLCLMISCVAASQLLIYRLTDGSYEDYDDDIYYNYIVDVNDGNGDDGNGNGDGDVSNYEGPQQQQQQQQQGRNKTNRPQETALRRRRRNQNRESALGSLVLRYRAEFTVARVTFDLGLVTLLLAVGVRIVAVFDQEIAVPVTAVIGTTAAFLATAYLTSYVEVFRQVEDSEAEEQKERQRQQQQQQTSITTRTRATNGIFRGIVPPLALASVGVGLYFISTTTGDFSGISLSRLGPYGITAGESKLRVVTEKVEAEKGKLELKERKRLKEQKSKKLNSINNSKPRGKLVLEKAEAERATAVVAERAAAEKTAAAEKVAAIEKAASTEKATSAEKTPKAAVEKVTAFDKSNSYEKSTAIKIDVIRKQS